MLDKTETELEHVRAYKSGGDIIVKGLTPEEDDLCLAGIEAGNFWVRKQEGRLIGVPIHKALPDPIEDTKMTPFWEARDSVEPLPIQLQLLELDVLPEHSSPSIIIRFLCGYNWSQENYESQAKRLTSYGFELLRSRRDKREKYCELWYLSSWYSAEGDLNAHIKLHKSTKDSETLSQVLSFLCENCQFGTLDVCVQRRAMCHPD